jgi:hypothetical protein
MPNNLQKKFLENHKLKLIDNLGLSIARIASDCDGMCYSVSCNKWYCEIYKQQYNKERNQ